MPKVHNTLPVLFCSVSRWHTTPLAKQVGLVLKHFPFTNAASQRLYVTLVCRFHILLGRVLRALRFPPTPKNQNPFIFLVNSSGLLLCVQSLLGCLGFNYVCAVAVTQRCLKNPVGWKSRVTKTANCYYYHLCLGCSLQTQWQIFPGIHSCEILWAWGCDTVLLWDFPLNYGPESYGPGPLHKVWAK